MTRVTGHAATGSSQADGVAATLAYYAQPPSFAFDSKDRMIVTDLHKLRRIESGLIATIAGDGTSGFLGENVPATQSRLATPVTIFVKDDHLYFTDANTNAIRVIW